jgi:hypothetical protein
VRACGEEEKGKAGVWRAEQGGGKMEEYGENREDRKGVGEEEKGAEDVGMCLCGKR